MENSGVLSEFEIGRVYRTTSHRYYLAMDNDLLVSLYDGKELIKRSMRPGWTIMAGMTAEELCAVWNIEFDALDALSDCYLSPRKPVFDPNKRRRRSKAEFTTYSPLIHRIARTD